LRNRAQDYVDLIAAANRAISKALADGDKQGKHAPGSWMSENMSNQLNHIQAHIMDYRMGDAAEDHLGHIVCRAAIAFALAEEQERRGRKCRRGR
jgi:hypothetical protein